jgi:small GTP-binding protein
MEEAEQDYTFKFIIVGNAYVGKSNISYRFINGTFCEKYHATVGLDFAYKTLKIDDKSYKIQIWDTAGQECFKSIARGYYKNSVCALIVYDITKLDSFNNVITWVEECKRNGPSTITMVLVGNKIDLEDKRVVSYEEGKDFAERNNMLFYETSALNGKNIDKLFKETLEKIIQKMNENYYDLGDQKCGITPGKGFRINNSKTKTKKRKCFCWK